MNFILFSSQNFNQKKNRSNLISNCVERVNFDLFQFEVILTKLLKFDKDIF